MQLRWLRCSVQEWVSRRDRAKLFGRSYHHLDIQAERACDTLCDLLLHRGGIGAFTPEDDIAALNVGHDIGVPTISEYATQIGHRQFPVAAHVNATDQRNVSHSGQFLSPTCIAACTNTGTSSSVVFTCRDRAGLG